MAQSKQQRVVNAWINGGDNASSGNVFFEGVTIYSYGRHFPMAKIVDDVVLYNRIHFSATTDRHQALVREAISARGLPRFDVVSFDDHQRNLNDYLGRIRNAIQTVVKARSTRRVRERELSELIDEANRYTKRFGLNVTVTDFQDIKAAHLALILDPSALSQVAA